MASTSPDKNPIDWRDSLLAQLHRIAENALRQESPGHSLQPTLLVNDAYLRLIEQCNLDPSNRSEVIAAGATIIRRLLVDFARARKAQKRGGIHGRGTALSNSTTGNSTSVDVVELHEALDAFSKSSPRAAKVVELKFFGGLSGEEIAKHLRVSPTTVKNEWRYAKAWLRRELQQSE